MSGSQHEIRSDRLPFDVEFFKRAEEFCNTAISDVPELHGIAIVPIWQTVPKDTPSGLLRLRNPQPPYIPSLLMLLKRLIAFNMDVHGDMAGQFNMYDRYAAELSRRIKAHQEELEQSGTTPQETAQDE